MHKLKESDTEEHDKWEEDYDRDWQEKFFRLRKTQKQLEDCTVQIEAKKRKKEKKEKKERKKVNFFIDECLHFNACNNFYNRLIREESKNIEKQNNVKIEEKMRQKSKTNERKRVRRKYFHW